MNGIEPTPEPGSARYFALLYTARARRPALMRLLALADEIGAGVVRGLDHDLAHARLAWWRHEAEQYALGCAQHPLLRQRPDDGDAAPPIDLESLLQAAAIDLALAQQRPPGGERLQRAVFAAAAPLLGAAALSTAKLEAIGALGALSWEREHLPAMGGAATARALQAVLARLGASLQPQLLPLLVWAALAAPPRKASMRRLFADNIRAWTIARRAAAGKFMCR